MSPKIRVALIIDGSETYGVQYSVRRLLKTLDRNAVHVIGVFLGHGPTWDALHEFCDEVVDLQTGCLLPLSRPGRSKYYLPNIFSKGYSFFNAILRGYRALRRLKPDVIHINFFPGHIVGGMIARLLGIPSIWHLRGSFPENKERMRIVANISYTLLADRIVCISKFVETTLPRHLRRKSCIVYNGIESSRIRDEQQKGILRKKIGLSVDVPLVGIFGSLIEYKGHEYFFQAAALVRQVRPDVYFVVVGGEEAIQKARYGRLAKLNQRCQELGMDDRVFFCPPIPEACLYMGDCDVICVPTIPLRICGEGFGLVTAEAMAAGVPVVATNCGATPEIVEDGRNGILFSPYDDQAFADAILKILSDPQLAQTFSKSASQRAHDVFDISYTAREMENVYRQVSERKRG